VWGGMCGCGLVSGENECSTRTDERRRGHPFQARRIDSTRLGHAPPTNKVDGVSMASIDWLLLGVVVGPRIIHSQARVVLCVKERERGPTTAATGAGLRCLARAIFFDPSCCLVVCSAWCSDRSSLPRTQRRERKVPGCRVKGRGEKAGPSHEGCMLKKRFDWNRLGFLGLLCVCALLPGA
jgi:hypothetical protein